MIELQANKDCILNVLDYLNAYETNDPAKFLKETCLGNYIEKLEKEVKDKDMKERLTAVEERLKRLLLKIYF